MVTPRPQRRKKSVRRGRKQKAGIREALTLVYPRRLGTSGPEGQKEGRREIQRGERKKEGHTAGKIFLSGGKREEVSQQTGNRKQNGRKASLEGRGPGGSQKLIGVRRDGGNRSWQQRKKKK